jgi:hypothetical protein
MKSALSVGQVSICEKYNSTCRVWLHDVYDTHSYLRPSLCFALYVVSDGVGRTYPGTQEGNN